MGPISDDEARGYVEHLLTCDDGFCGHYAHMWASMTEQGRQYMAQARRADRDQARR